MKRGRLRKVSSRQKLINETQSLFGKVIVRARGSTCEICKTRKGAGLFHILPVGGYPRLRFHSWNVLWSCWMPCHFNWHHDFKKAKKVEQRIIELRGEGYEDELRALNAMQPPLSLHQISMYNMAFNATLKGEDK